LLRGRPAPRWDRVSKALPYVVALIKGTDDETKMDALWSLAYLTDEVDTVQYVAGFDVCSLVVANMRRFVVAVGMCKLSLQAPLAVISSNNLFLLFAAFQTFLLVPIMLLKQSLTREPSNLLLFASPTPRTTFERRPYGPSQTPQLEPLPKYRLSLMYVDFFSIS
jgi:hypothetical protein